MQSYRHIAAKLVTYNTHKADFLERDLDLAACSHVLLLGQLDFSELLTTGHHVLVLDTHDRNRGRVDSSLVLDVLGTEVLLESAEVGHILLVDVAEGEAGGLLGVDKGAEGGLGLNDAVRNVLAAAESRQERHHLDGLNVVSDDNKLGLAILDESGDVVETELEDDGLGADVVSLVALLALLSLSLESLLLHGLVLGLVAVEKLEELGGLVLVEGLGEDVKSSGHLKTHHKNSLLTLDADILGPLDEAGQVASGLDVTANTEVTGGLLEQGVLLGLGFTGGNNLLACGLLGHVKI